MINDGKLTITLMTDLILGMVTVLFAIDSKFDRENESSITAMA